MKITATKLRENLYNILDKVLEIGVPVEVERKGRILKIVPESKPSKLAKLKSEIALLVTLKASCIWIGSRSGAN